MYLLKKNLNGFLDQGEYWSTIVYIINDAGNCFYYSTAYDTIVLNFFRGAVVRSMLIKFC